MEDGIKISKVKYLSNYCSDFPQLSNMSSGVQTKIKFGLTSNGRQPPMEDDLKILKVKYLSNH
jgi:hypothetical protein